MEIAEDRFATWVKVSHTLAKFEFFMVPLAQRLGKLDATLIEEDGRLIKLSSKDLESIPETLSLNDHITFSYLWILGTYELIRTLDQRCKEKPSLLDEQLRNDVRNTKYSFERLRIPLAKMEPAQRHRQTDYTIAYPAINPRLGIAWKVSDDMFISRRELSDLFLNLLRRMLTNTITR